MNIRKAPADEGWKPVQLVFTRKRRLSRTAEVEVNCTIYLASCNQSLLSLLSTFGHFFSQVMRPQLYKAVWLWRLRIKVPYKNLINEIPKCLLEKTLLEQCLIWVPLCNESLSALPAGIGFLVSGQALVYMAWIFNMPSVSKILLARFWAVENWTI